MNAAAVNEAGVEEEGSMTTAAAVASAHIVAMVEPWTTAGVQMAALHLPWVVQVMVGVPEACQEVAGTAAEQAGEVASVPALVHAVLAVREQQEAVGWRAPRPPMDEVAHQAVAVAPVATASPAP